MIELTKLELCEQGNKEINITLSRQGEKKELQGIVMANSQGDYLIRVRVVHQEAGTSGRVTIRGIVSGGARLKLGGEVIINKDISGVEDELDFKILVLDQESKAEIVPQMEIEARDVIARHACSVGSIDNNEIFYLMSRGLSRKKAESLIVKGFLSGAAGKIDEVN